MNGGVDLSGFTGDNIGMLLQSHDQQRHDNAQTTSRAAVIVVAAKEVSTVWEIWRRATTCLLPATTARASDRQEAAATSTTTGPARLMTTSDDIKLLRRRPESWRDSWTGSGAVAGLQPSRRMGARDCDCMTMMAATVSGARLDRLAGRHPVAVTREISTTEEPVASRRLTS